MFSQNNYTCFRINNQDSIGWLQDIILNSLYIKYHLYMTAVESSIALEMNHIDNANETSDNITLLMEDIAQVGNQDEQDNPNETNTVQAIGATAESVEEDSAAPIESITESDNISQQYQACKDTFENEFNYYVNFNSEGQDNAANIFKHYPMVCRTTDGKQLGSIIGALSKVIDKAYIEFRPDCWLIHPTEIKSSRLVIGKFKASEFDNYYCPTTFHMVFDLKEIAVCLKSLKPGLKQTLIFKVNRQAELSLVIDNPITGGVNTYPIHQKEWKEESLRIPPLKPECQILLTLAWYKDAIDTLADIGKASDNKEITLCLMRSGAFVISIPGGYQHSCIYQGKNKVESNENGTNGTNEAHSGTDIALFKRTFNIDDLKTFLTIQSVNKHSLLMSISPAGVLIFEQAYGKNAGCLQYMTAPIEDSPTASHSQFQEQSNHTNSSSNGGNKRKSDTCEAQQGSAKRVC